MDKMNEALEELKRVDHLIYVSLKYTRTVDVIINILSRMVDGYALMVDALLALAQERGKYSGEPESAIERAELVRELYGKDIAIADNMALYLLLRKLLRARSIARENEYRRHVTMKTVVEGREEIVNIDIITNYYLFQREFIMHVKSIVDGKVEVEIAERSALAHGGAQWGQEDESREEHTSTDDQAATHKTPPKKNTLKVRPVGSPPRKRAPRPKKYKIQIPKGKNSITLPYEYDPHFRKEMEKEKARLKAEADAKEKLAKAAARKSAPAKPRARRSAKPAHKARSARPKAAKKAATRKSAPGKRGKKGRK
jgi:hypothetical protein